MPSPTRKPGRLSPLPLLLLLPALHASALSAQLLEVRDPFLVLNAGGDDPTFTTYGAAMERSTLYGDKAYKMVHYENSEPLYYESDRAGRLFTLWLVNELAIMNTGEFHQAPRIYCTFPDMVITEYMPLEELRVQETFLVYSSSVALVHMHLENVSDRELDVSLFPALDRADSLTLTGYDPAGRVYEATRYETHERLISNLYAHAPYPSRYREALTGAFDAHSYGGYTGPMRQLYDTIKVDHYAEDRPERALNRRESGMVDVMALHHKLVLEPGETADVRYIRGSQDVELDPEELRGELARLRDVPLQPFLDANVALFESVPRIDFDTDDERMVYLGAFNLIRGSMLPPSGETRHNFYVFSRNPTWGWGHGHQVLHESLAMIPYAYLDPESAQNSQRVYMEQQFDDGLIAYRHGPRGPQVYETRGQPTTSAPFFSWINWELFQVSGDRDFLREAYEAGKRYVHWLEKNRDKDQDGTFEWGPYGIIENVRDWHNVIFQVSEERYLGVDSEDISDMLECLDLSLMVHKEMISLGKMAEALGDRAEVQYWRGKAEHLAHLINERMWDDETGFYYHVDMENHEFELMGSSLKRKEIIGFLPMWADVAPGDRAERLLAHLTDPAKFWRPYGIPTLSAADPRYSPDVDYCCKWNGPVWLQWSYMVFHGLQEYGYYDLADEVAETMMRAVTTQLRKNHNFWESFSPDNTVLNSPTNYIWDSVMAKVLIDRYLNRESREDQP
jgi:hypothetical protein